MRQDKRFRLALGSFVEEYSNKVEIITLDEQRREFPAEPTHRFDHPYPCTKIMFVPDTEGTGEDLLATSGDYLRVWRIGDDGVHVRSLLNNNKNSVLLRAAHVVSTGAPPTWRGWAPAVWTPRHHLGPGEGDGGLAAHRARQGGVRHRVGRAGGFRKRPPPTGASGCSTCGIRTTARSCTSPRRGHAPAEAWLEQAEPEVHGDDGDGQLQGCGAGHIRVPALPVAELKRHRAAVNTLAWAPHSLEEHSGTAGDDAQALIWDSGRRWRSRGRTGWIRCWLQRGGGDQSAAVERDANRLDSHRIRQKPQVLHV